MKRKTNLSLHPEILRRAEELMGDDACESLSNFVEQLIRDEWRRRTDHPGQKKSKSDDASLPVNPVGKRKRNGPLALQKTS